MSLRSIKDNGLEAQQLKEKYLRCFGVRATNAAALQEAVKGLIERGFCHKTLVIWAVEAGYRKAYISCILCRISRALGLRQRRAGAGRKPLTRSLEHLRYAQAKYGAQCLNALQGALRAGKAEKADAARNRLDQTRHATELIAPSQLHNLGTNCEGAIKHSGNPVCPTSLSFHPSA